jgi:maleylacetate reductase
VRSGTGAGEVRSGTGAGELRFSHRTLGQRVVLDPGQAASRLLAELDRLDPRAVMVIGGARQRPLLDRLADRTALRWTEVAQHVPVALAVRARAAAAEHGVDVVVAVGGGSAIGLAKAIALDRPVRIVAVPTTYAGSEATNVWGLTDESGKRTGSDDRVLPETVVYDPALTLSMPAELAAASGLNAVAHCVDSFWGPAADPIDTALAGEGLRALDAGLRALTVDAGDLSGRGRTQYGCYLAAVAFASAGSAMHHKICHVLGGRFDLPHAATHAIVLPYVLAYNAGCAPAAAERIAVALGVADPVQGIEELRTLLVAPRALRDIGLREADLPAAVEAALPAIPPSNPRPVDAGALSRLLRAAWAGDDPGGLT